LNFFSKIDYFRSFQPLKIILSVLFLKPEKILFLLFNSPKRSKGKKDKWMERGESRQEKVHADFLAAREVNIRF